MSRRLNTKVEEKEEAKGEVSHCRPTTSKVAHYLPAAKGEEGKMKKSRLFGARFML